MRKNDRSKACDISPKVRREVYRRDSDFCVYCGKYLRHKELAHVVSRAQGGLGIPENLVTLGARIECDCHYIFDNGTKAQRAAMLAVFADYLRGFYPDWKEENLIYRRWE